MTATDELRRMLNERGVEYHEYHSQISGSMEGTTRFYLHDNEHHPYASIEVGDVSADALLTLRCTPEQAIEATLGRRTCHNASEYPRMFFCCSECGCSHKRNRAYVDMPRFCPACGREVVTDG